MTALLAAALLAPAASAVRCTSDDQIDRTWLTIAARYATLSGAQNTAIAAADEARLRTTTLRLLRFSRDSRARLKALRPGTTDGSQLQAIAFRFFEQIDRTNRCVIAYVNGGPGRGAQLTSCLASTQRGFTALTRALVRLHEQVAATVRACR